ncbi:hypothetical protein ACQEVZ_53695 [Dactylosporangium sp. CA-152071]|uniref:hypothetical protein n=1 Tax=Dactylosporangium sp. CA-152071 TaxID=3239933 RepID=UPI003D8B6365
MDTIDDAIATADRTWRAQGVSGADRTSLAADLRADLAAAAEDGIGPAELLGPDVPGFARRLADEAGVRRVPREYLRFLRTSIAGALLGGAAGFALITMVVHPLLVALFDLPRSVKVPILLAAGIFYGAAVAFAVTGSVAAVRIRLRHLPYTGNTANAMAVLIPAAALVAAPLTVGFARLTGYSTSPWVVLTECALVVAAHIGAVLLARRWALREPGTSFAI